MTTRCHTVPHNIQDTSEGLESFDAPATPPDQFDGQDHEVPNDFGSNDNVVMEDVMPDYEERAPPAVPQPGVGEDGGEGVQESYEPESSLQPEPTTESPTTEPLTNEPPTKQPPTREPPTKEPPTKEPQTVQPPTDPPETTTKNPITDPSKPDPKCNCIDDFAFWDKATEEEKKSDW